MPTTESICSTALDAARAAGEIQRKHFGTTLHVDAAKAHDIKLEVDRLCEEAIVRIVKARFPTHAILAEERGTVEGSEYVWIIDPLDGTVNFFYGLPWFCTSVACYRSAPDTRTDNANPIGEPVAGVIFAPATNECFHAVRGGGAFLNDEPIHTTRITQMSDALIATGFGSVEANIKRMCGANQGLISKVRKLRCLGAAAYDMANVAAGRLSGFYERGIRTWDIAAGAILIEEAGGTHRLRPCPGVDESQRAWDVVASGAQLFPALCNTLDTL